MIYHHKQTHPYLIQAYTFHPFSFPDHHRCKMAEDKPKHHLFHHHKDGEKPIDAVGISDTTYSTDGVNDYTDSTTVVVAEQEPDYGHEEREHKHHEHLGELGAVAAGAFALVNLLTLLRFRYPFVNCTCDDHVFSFLLYMV